MKIATKTPGFRALCRFSVLCKKIKAVHEPPLPKTNTVASLLRLFSSSLLLSTGTRARDTISVSSSLSGQKAAADGFWQRLDPRVKMLCMFSWLAAVIATPVYHYQKFLAYTVIIISLGVMARVRVKHYLLRFIFLIPLLLFIGGSLLVFSHQEWPQKAMAFYNLIVKTFLTFCSFGLMVLTVEFNQLLKSLETMKFPAVLTNLLAFAYRYLLLFQQEAGRMITARKARTFGRRKTWKERKIAAAVIPYFLFRVLERSQKVYVAMLSRGYRDFLPVGISTPLTLTGVDYLFGSLFHLVLGIIFIIPKQF